MKGWIALIAALGLATACSGGGGGGDGGGAPVGDFQLGDPVEGLPAAETASFFRGKELFERRFRPSEGLGPYYNSASCVACHETPVVGGSATAYRNFILAGVGFPGSQTAVPANPPLPSQVVPSFFYLVNRRVDLPQTVNGLPVTPAIRNVPPLFGTGLFEFVTNATIQAGADPDDADADGISGRFNRDPFFNMGRFGYKCQANNIESFIRGASNNQMGMTTNPVLGSNAAVGFCRGPRPQVGQNPNTPQVDGDGIPDPEISVSEFADIINFCRFIAPPRRKAVLSSSAQNGELLFAQIGCTECHVPTIQSSFGPLQAYTDLLIHDMGPGLADGISQGSPQPSVLAASTTENEFRTQPLWGVAAHAPFLHNGTADTLEAAILAHGGEAQAIRDAFQALPQSSKDDIIAFLESL